MNFFELPLAGAYLIEPEKLEDERGFFARSFCRREYEKLGLNNQIVQMSISYNKTKGTLRGIHYQLPPKAENKIVRSLKGSFWDVMIDLRKNSPTFGKWHGEILSSDNRKMVYIPEGFGHAFITLEEDSEPLYLVTEYYEPNLERTIRWDDSFFSIDWPIKPTSISSKDKNARDFDPSYHLD